MTSRAAVQEVLNVVLRTRSDCRMCGHERLAKVWSFGKTPLANNYLTPQEVAAGQAEPLAPLEVYKCEDCHLVQMRDVVDPKVLFGNYLYVSSTSPAFVAHFEEYAKALIDRFHLTEKDLVVDVGSNDGVLLKPLQALGVRVLGVEPAQNIAGEANNHGIPTVAEFFLPAVAEKLKETYGSAKVIAANNVFAHTDELEKFVEAVKTLLAPEGVFVFEVQYLGDLITKNLFDIIYHEHLCYYHLHPLVQFFKKHGMRVFDVERPTVHGGSLRVYVQLAGGSQARHARLQQILDQEDRAGLNTLAPYQEFAQRIEHNKQKLRQMLSDIKRQGKRIVGYGAPAKATTLCYAFGIDENDLSYIVDDSPLKQGRLMPGTHIPIVSSTKLKEDAPDFCLILAWNFAEPIMKNNGFFAEQGGQWILPVPEPRVV